MAYRIKVDTDYPQIECDSATEVLDLLKSVRIPLPSAWYYENSLYYWILVTEDDGDPESVEAIRKLWDGESWDAIVRKTRAGEVDFPGWWMVGVRKFAANGFGRQRRR